MIHVGVITDKTGNPDNDVRGKLPADIINPIIAYSLNRKLRYTYTGEYFRYRQASGGEADYPTATPDLSETVYVTKMYDQKSKHGFPAVNVEQASESLQPTLSHDGTFYRANFAMGQYMELDSVTSYVSADFHIMLVGQGEFPRPAFGLWGASDKISVEPAANARFTVNENHGGMVDHAGRGVLSCFSGYHMPSNGNRVMSVIGSGASGGDMTTSVDATSLTSAAIGRNDTRYFTGEVFELVMNLGDLYRSWGDLMHQRTIEVYTNYN